MFAARTPVVSAIGHEPDSPLLDLVADVRASTPTDAAKLVVPDVAEEARAGRRSCASAAAQLLDRLAGPRAARPRRAARPAGAGRPAQRAGERAADEVDALRDRARRTLAPPARPGRATTSATSWPGSAALSPLATLRRGYAVLQDADGHVVTSVGAGARPAHACSVRVADGRDRAPPSTGTEPDRPDRPRGARR